MFPFFSFFVFLVPRALPPQGKSPDEMVVVLFIIIVFFISFKIISLPKFFAFAGLHFIGRG